MSGFTGASPPWHVERREVSAQAAHDDDLFARSGRKMRVFVPAAPAVVLGSTQRDDIVDRAVAAARGLAIARRRSGGGAVLVDATVVWIDFAIGRDDPDETTDACGRVMEELMSIERAEVLGAIRGADHYETLWQRQQV